MTGSYNLIGTGGSGGIAGGSGGNIVLTSLAEPGPGPARRLRRPDRNHGAIARQRGHRRRHGRRVASPPTSGGRPGRLPAPSTSVPSRTRATPWPFVGKPSKHAGQPGLQCSAGGQLTENFANAPLPGATIGFSAPSSGASATLSAELGGHRRERPGERHGHGQRDRRHLCRDRLCHRSDVVGFVQPDQPDRAELLGADRPDGHLRQYGNVHGHARGRFAGPRLEKKSPSRSTVSRTTPRSAPTVRSRPNSPVQTWC